MYCNHSVFIFCTGEQIFSPTDYTMPLHNNAKKGREGSDSDASYAPERELATSRDDPHPSRGRAKPPPQPVDNQGERRDDMAEFFRHFFNIRES